MDTARALAPCHNRRTLPHGSPPDPKSGQRRRFSTHDTTRVGNDDRLLVVAEPDSIPDRDHTLTDATGLQAPAAPLADALRLAMRSYFEKLRTTGGWKGDIHDPHLGRSVAINEGLERARRLLLQIAGCGLPVGTERKNTRQLVSALRGPVGFKNGNDGGVNVAVDASVAAAARHAFMATTKMGQAAVFETRCDPDCRAIVRGGARPNYDVGPANPQNPHEC